METVVQPPADTDLHLLTEWSEPGRGQRTRTAAALSLLVHAAVILLLVLVPGEVLQPPRQVERIVTPLIEPLTELTQKAPNTGKVNKEFNAVEKQPRPRLQAPFSPPPVEHAAASRPAPVPPMLPPKSAPPVALPEPPKVEAPANAPPKVDLPQLAAAPPPPVPPPQIQAEEKPKLIFESPPPPTQVAPSRSRVPIPGSPVEEAIRQAARNNTPGGLIVGDAGASGFGGYGGGINIPAAPGIQGGSVQLLSDPMGVDFVPYLRQILATVKRNWMNVMPESVKLGRRGKVAIQFSIARDGRVPKLVIIPPGSGTDALDRAAVAGISASNPFPPLPSEFKGDRVVLQFNFAYNMPRQ